MHFIGQFCGQDEAPYRDIAVRRTRTIDRGADVSFTAPSDWPLSAGIALAALDLDRADAATGRAGHERDLPDFLSAAGSGRDVAAEPAVLAVLDRLAARWTGWGWRFGFFDMAADARAFFDDVRWLLVRRALAPDAAAWRGIAGRPPLRGFGVDPFSGTVLPAHALPGFAPGATAEADARPAVVRLIQDATAARSDQTADIPAPVVAIDLMQLLGHSGALDAGALAHAARLATLIAEIELATRVYRSDAQARAVFAQRPIAVGPVNLGAYLTAQGLAHDSDAGRALAQATVGLITAAAATASAELAGEAGPCPAFAAIRRPIATALKAQCAAMQRAAAWIGDVARPEHLAGSARAIAATAEPLWEAALAGAEAGLRHSRFTAIQTATAYRPLPIGLQSVGVRPLASLVLDQELADGRFARVVAPAVIAGAAMLGCGTGVQAAMIRQLRGRRSVADAPGVSLASLRAKGLDDAALARVDAALQDVADIRHAFSRWVLGAAACDEALGLDPALAGDYGFDLLAALGYTPAAIEAANRHCLGADTLAGTPGLADQDASVLAVPGDGQAMARAETRMIEALNAVLSETAARPVPETATNQPQDHKEPASAAPALALATAGRS